MRPTFGRVLSPEEVAQFLAKIQEFAEQKKAVGDPKEARRLAGIRRVLKILSPLGSAAWLLRSPRAGDSLGNDTSDLNRFVAGTPEFREAGLFQGRFYYLCPGLLELGKLPRTRVADDNGPRQLDHQALGLTEEQQRALEAARAEGEAARTSSGARGPKCYLLCWRVYNQSVTHVPSPEEAVPESEPEAGGPRTAQRQPAVRLFIARSLQGAPDAHARLTAALEACDALEGVEAPSTPHPWDEEHLSSFGTCQAFAGCWSVEHAPEFLLALGRRLPCFDVSDPTASPPGPAALIRVDPNLPPAQLAAEIVKGCRAEQELSAIVQDIACVATSSAGRESPFLRPFLREVLQFTKSQAEQAVSEQFRVDIRQQQSFLMLAGPLFRTAASVLAVSIDTVSTFWADQGPEAGEYLANQPEDTVRLHVFASPEALMEGREMLAKHVAKYGDTGAVFVTSHDRYQQYMQEAGLGPHFDTNHDFGILHYQNGETLIAKLDGQYLSFTLYGPEKSLPREHQEFRAVLQEARKHLDKYQNSLRRPDIPLKMVRWGKGLSEPTEEHTLRDCLPDLFPRPRQPVYHAIGLKVGKKKALAFRTHLEEVLRSLTGGKGIEEFKKEFNIIDLAFLERVRRADYKNEEVRRLRLAPPSLLRYVLWMKFRSQDDLERYYLDPEHKRIRWKFYSRFADPKLQYLLDKLEQNPTDEIARALLEDQMGSYLFRLDFHGGLALLRRKD
jgi:hypothetical protein